MEQIDYAGILPATGILESLGETSRRQLTAIGIFSKLMPGDTLIQEGQQQDFLFMILDGQLEVTTEVAGKPVQLGILVAGDCIGEMGMLDQQAACATVTAIFESVVWSLNVDQFEQFLAQNNLAAAQILLAISRTLSERLRDANDLIRRSNIIPTNISVRAGKKEQPVTLESCKGQAGSAFSIFKKGPKDYPKAKISQAIKL